MKPPANNSAQPGTVVGIAPHGGSDVSHAVPAADAAALSLVFLLAFCVVCFAWGAAVLGRRERKMMALRPYDRPDDAEPARNGPQDDTKAAHPEWERDGDWWKR